jgi:hypothetical protein
VETDAESSMLSNAVQFSNAFSPISLTVEGTINSPDFPPGQQRSVFIFLSYNAPSTVEKYAFAFEIEISCRDVQ